MNAPAFAGQVTDPVARMLSIVGLPMPYELGTGNYVPESRGVGAGGITIDLPWTTNDGRRGSDCAGAAICYAHRIRRHRPGFNRHAKATVSDDINTDSAVQDARAQRAIFEAVIDHERRIFREVLPGDLLIWESVLSSLDGHQMKMGHVAHVIAKPDPAFVSAAPDYHLLRVAQCCGPDGRRPAVILTDGRAWAKHDRDWGTDKDPAKMPLAIHRRSLVIRVRG